MTVKYVVATHPEHRIINGNPVNTCKFIKKHQYDKLTFHEYCELNPEYTDSDFEKGFELIAKNYNIKLN